MYKIICTLIFVCSGLFWVTNCNAQQNIIDVEADTVITVLKIRSEFDIALDSMSVLMRKAAASQNINEKEQLSVIFQHVLVNELSKENSFNFPFDTISHVAILTSADSLVRLFSWSIPAQQKNTHRYYCVLQHRLNKNTKVSDIFELEDTKANIKLPEHEELKYPNWYGCIYYQLVQKNDGKKVYYTLMGHDFYDGISYKKCIDVLTFDRRNNPVFGAPIFLLEKKAQQRVLFEYSSQSVMKLAYFDDIEAIAYNYLYPIVEEKRNDRRYYVPDVTYEGLIFKLGKWIKVPNIEIKKID